MYAKRLRATEGEITRRMKVTKKGKTERKYGETVFFLSFPEQGDESSGMEARRMRRWAQKRKLPLKLVALLTRDTGRSIYLIVQRSYANRIEHISREWESLWLMEDGVGVESKANWWRSPRGSCRNWFRRGFVQAHTHARVVQDVLELWMQCDRSWESC